MNNIKIKTGNSVVITENISSDISPILEKLGFSYWLKENFILKISQGYIGQIVTNKNNISISPSISYLSTINYLKLITPNLEDISNGQNLDYIQDDKVSLFIINKFFDLLHLLIKEGIPYKYINSTSYSNYFVGNVDIIETFSRVQLNLTPVVKSNVQSLSINYFVIVILWQAYDKVIKNNPSLKNAFIEKIFFYVEKQKYTNIQIYKFRTNFHRNETILASAYNFAKLIIMDMNILTGHESLNASLLINSNLIFEEFIMKLFNTFLPNEPFIYHDGLKTIAFANHKSNLVSIEPDILYKGIETIVFDVKNKDFNKMFSNNDFYQLYTYCRAYKSKKGVLIYPSNENSTSIKVLTSFDKDIVFYAISIDISKSSNSERLQSYNDFLKNINDVISFT